MSDEDFAALTGLQTTVRTNDSGAESSRLQAVTRLANHALRTAGIDPTSGPDSDATQAATFHRALQDELSAFESRGRTATKVEIQNIADWLMKTAIKGGWIRTRNRQAFPTEALSIPIAEQKAALRERPADARMVPDNTADGPPVRERVDDQTHLNIDRSHVHPAQSVVPFLAKPPNYPVNPRPTLKYKEPIPGLSGKEKAKDIPRTFEGMRPLVGESGRQAAERAFNEKYGKGNWNIKNPRFRREFGKLRKYFDRGFRDPQSLPGPYGHIPGEDFEI